MVEWISGKAGRSALVSFRQVPSPVPSEVIHFFTRRYKTSWPRRVEKRAVLRLWCPYGTQHGWHECLYARSSISLLTRRTMCKRSKRSQKFFFSKSFSFFWETSRHIPTRTGADGLNWATAASHAQSASAKRCLRKD